MTFERYIKKNGKKYRMGFTTGSAAAAAAKAASEMFFSGRKNKNVKIDTPANIKLELEVAEIDLNENYVKAGIVKDGGDDPDVTNGLLILARAESISERNILIKGGRGVGKVTKPGLPISPGKSAINPVPRKMIKKEVRKVIPDDKGMKITIEIPEGKKIAKKTFNPRLGIEGGISVLGTTGIVEPMSKSAYKESLALELKQAVEMGRKDLVFVFGNHGKKLAKKLGYNEEDVIRMSNFVGYMLDKSEELEINSLIIIGHIGKIAKVAAGIYNTHSKVADARQEIIASYAALFGAKQNIVEKIFESSTAENAANIVLENDLASMFNFMAKRIVNKIRLRLKNEKLGIGSMIFSLEKGILGSYGIGKEELEYE